MNRARNRYVLAPAGLAVALTLAVAPYAAAQTSLHYGKRLVASPFQ